MKNVLLAVLMGLMNLAAMASPQTSDADLKALQAPVVETGDYPNFHGQRVVVKGSHETAIPSCNAYSIDLSSFGANTSDFPSAVLASDNAGTPISGVTTLGAYLGSLLYIDLSRCGLGDDVLVAFIGAIEAQGTCEAKVLMLEGNAFTTLDLSGGGIGWAFGTLDFSGNTSLATLNGGDGVSTGLVYFQGSTLNLSGCALTNASEDSLLDAAMEMEMNSPGQDATVDISGGTSAAPDGEGASDISNLASAGWTITTN